MNEAETVNTVQCQWTVGTRTADCAGREAEYL